MAGLGPDLPQEYEKNAKLLFIVTSNPTITNTQKTK